MLKQNMRKFNLLWIFVLFLLVLTGIAQAENVTITAMDNYTQYGYEQTNITNFTATNEINHSFILFMLFSLFNYC